MRVSCNARVICVSALFFLLSLAGSLSAQDVPDKYKRFFIQYSDKRGVLEKGLNSLFHATSVPIGRSFALIAGVSQYPKLTDAPRSLEPAALDIKNLVDYLKKKEFFDEIVVLQDNDMTFDNLRYFLGTYFPRRIAGPDHTRFLFAYSGHGYAEGKGKENLRGYLLTSLAAKLRDPENRIDLDLVHTALGPVIESAEKVLVLINSCQSGVFLRRSFGPPTVGSSPISPGERSARAITASKADQLSLQTEAGRGSVFFEKTLAGLAGAADTNLDGIVTFHELNNYLLEEVRNATNGTQTPDDGDLARDHSAGGFFFLNKSRPVRIGVGKPLNPQALIFGEDTGGEHTVDEFGLGRAALLAKDFEKAAVHFDRAAGNGNIEAMFQLGQLHADGIGVPQNYGKARQWYEKAALGGNASAMVSMGTLYARGQGGKLDYSLARQWYEKAVGAGNATAMNNLGLLYANGYGAKQDYAQARQWFEKAAEAGNAPAMNNLGLLYANGQVVKQDYVLAQRWYERAATAGDPDSMFKLGYMYTHSQGVTLDYVAGREWYERAAKAGNAEAMNSLAGLYDSGDGGRQDFQKAHYWLEQSATAGNTDAMNKLGYNYDYGSSGVQQDYTQARQWYERAATAGSTIAMTSLGFMYANGRGVPRDCAKARGWYEKATAAGSEDAAERLKTLPRDEICQLTNY